MPLNLLCIEDDPDIRFILELALQQTYQGREIQIRMAESGAEARQLLAQQPVDLLLLDQMLPDSSGLDFLEAMRRQAGFQSLNAILLSARFNAQQTESWQKPGVIGLISKPFEPHTLAERIWQLWLDKNVSEK